MHFEKNSRKIQVEKNDGESQPPDEQVLGTDERSETPLVRVGVDILPKYATANVDGLEEVPGTDGELPLSVADTPPKNATADGDGLREVPGADGESLVEGDAIESAEKERIKRALEFLKPTLSYSTEKTDWSGMSMTSAFFVVMGEVCISPWRRLQDSRIQSQIPKLDAYPKRFFGTSSGRCSTPRNTR